MGDCVGEGCDKQAAIRKSSLCLTCYGKRWRANHPERMAIYKERHTPRPTPRHCMDCSVDVAPPHWICDGCRPTHTVPSQTTWARRLRGHGLDEAGFAALMLRQGEACAICAKAITVDTLHIDHDHATGQVRGLLCSGCNTGLGKLGDTVEGLLRAVEYLRG